MEAAETEYFFSVSADIAMEAAETENFFSVSADDFFSNDRPVQNPSQKIEGNRPA